MHKEPNGTLVMTTCKCRENTTNLVMTRTWFQEQLHNKIAIGVEQEQKRIIELLVKADTTHLNSEGLKGWYFALALIKGETND